MNNISQNWKNCLKIIQKNVSSQAFETWFASIDVVSVEGQQITLQVPNRFHYEWLESKYGELLESALKKTFGTKLRPFTLPTLPKISKWVKPCGDGKIEDWRDMRELLLRGYL